MRRKLAAALLVTLAFGISIGVMYILWARFMPVYFYIALGSYALLLVLALLLVGRRPRSTEDEVERDLETHSAREDDVSPATASLRAPTAIFDDAPDGIPIHVEKATGMAPTHATAAETAPDAAYTFRGFTLYERSGKKGVQRFFSKGKPIGGGQAIALPEGFEAHWDATKNRPVLRPIASPEPSPLTAPEPQIEVSRPVARMPVGVRTRTAPAPEEPSLVVQKRACAAFTEPGIMCSRSAQEGSPYCGRHEDYDASDMMGDIEVRRDTRASGSSPFRAGVPRVEVRTQRKESKPLRLRPAQVEVRTARPSTHPGIQTGRARPEKRKPVERRLSNPSEQPFQTRIAKPQAKPLKMARSSPVEGRLDRRPPSKPLRVKTAADPAVRTAKPVAKPLRGKQASDPIVRPAPTLADTKPLRGVAAKEPVVRRAPTLASAKPIRAAASPEPVVRAAPTLAKSKPFRLKDADDIEVNTGRAAKRSGKRCRGRLQDGSPCPADAAAGGSYCGLHELARTASDAVVVRDSRSRSSTGVPESPARRKR